MNLGEKIAKSIEFEKADDIMEQGGMLMLVSFSLKNVYSFRDEAVLSLDASPIRAHSYSLLEARNKKYLPVIAIYGANASGKSNLLRALKYIIGTIANAKSEPTLCFMLSEDMSQGLSEVKLKFILKENLFEYRLKCIIDNVYEEQLSFIPPQKQRPMNLFLRNWDTQKKNWELCAPEKTTTFINSAMLEEIRYVSSMATNWDELLLPALGKRGNLSIFADIFQWAKQTVAYNHKAHSDVGFPTYTENSDIFRIFSQNPEDTTEKEEFLRFIQSINPMIASVNLGKVKKADQYSLTWDYKLRPELLNQALSNDLRTDEVVSFYESRGVYLAADLFPSLYHVLHYGGLLVVDELENSLHPLLMAKVISMFTDPETNPGKGQLVFTTHNALLMDKKYFRQDEIVFTEKDKEGCSSLYRLSDIEGVRSDRDFCKSYICGAFGAIPEFDDKEDDGSE